MEKKRWHKDYFKVDPARSNTERGKLMIENHNKRVDEIDLAQQYGDIRKQCKMINMTTHSLTSKMAHKHSISTSVVLNDFCQARQCMKCKEDGKEAVCPYCFANAINNARPTVDLAMRKNSMILWQEEIPVSIWEEVWKKKFLSWNEPDFRIESLGDARTVTQAENYIRLEYAIKEMIETEWSKNWRIWLQAFRNLGKPKNSRYVHSCLYLNVIEPIPEPMIPYVDFRFTVCTPEWLAMHPEIKANCCTPEQKHRKCREDCHDSCYSKNPEECEFDRIEVVRGYKK